MIVAVELALESGPPSGRVSVEHFVNVLGRLTAPAAPQSAQTALQIIRRRWPTRPNTPACADRRWTKRDVAVELKVLPLHAMVSA